MMPLRVLLGVKNAEDARITIPQVLSLIQPLLIKYNTFPIECHVKCEIAAFNVNIKKMFDILMNLTMSDREAW